LTSELTQQVVYRGYVRAQNTGTAFRLTAIPDSIPPLSEPLKFDRTHLERIYRAGYEGIQQQNFWWTKPPTIRRFDRIAKR